MYALLYSYKVVNRILSRDVRLVVAAVRLTVFIISCCYDITRRKNDDKIMLL